MTLREQADLDFARARRRASFRRLRVRLQKGSFPDRLLCFEDARRRLGAHGGRVHRGLKTVRMADVVGSVGRCSEFGGTFLPNKASTGARWKAVDRAFHWAEELPPVSLYKLGHAYFVLDGNHRVSVARYHGVEWIDAEVTEFGVQPRSAPKRVEIGEEQRMPKTPEGLRKRGVDGGRNDQPVWTNPALCDLRGGEQIACKKEEPRRRAAVLATLCRSPSGGEG
jgi:hypothetical protein